MSTNLPVTYITIIVLINIVINNTNTLSDIRSKDLINETPAGIKNIAILSKKKLLTSFILSNFITLALSSINNNIIPIILPGITTTLCINELIYSPKAHKPNIMPVDLVFSYLSPKNRHSFKVKVINHFNFYFYNI